MANGPFTRRRLSNEIADLQTNLLQVAPYIGGKTIFVSSTLGSNANDGLSTSAPVATLTYAISLLSDTSPNDSAIVLMAGHAETVHTAAWLSISATGIRIIGLCQGRQRAKLTWDATAAQILVTGAGVKFENIVFDFTGIDAVVAGFAVDAADVQFVNCEFICNAAAAGVVSGITVGGSTTSPRFTVENCRFLGPAINSGTTTTAHITLTDAPDFVLKNNYHTGKMTQAITNGSAILRGLIEACKFVIATGTKAINMHASSTPFCVNNRINVPSGAAPIVAAAGFVAGNIYSAAAGVTAVAVTQ